MWEDPRRDTRQRLSVSEAADVLGVTVDAVRSRVKRGTIARVRESGRVYVLLGDDESPLGHDQYADQVSDQGARGPEDRTAELIVTLREQLQAERQAHAEARRIIAGLVERIPAIEASAETPEASETVEEQQARVSPTPMPQALRRAYRGPSGGGCSEDRRSMQNDQTTQDAKRLLAAMSTNHSEARMASPYGLDRPFSPNWADAEQAGLDRVRRDAAMWWLIDNDLLEREEEAENLRDTGKGVPDYDYVYGSVFRITEHGRELLEEIWEERRQQ